MQLSPRPAARLRLFASLLYFALSFAAQGAPTAKSPELDKAITALKQEYTLSAKSNPEKLPKESSFFTEAGTIPPDALLAALEKPIPGVPASDARQTAYVKWQLLSAMPSSPEEPAVKRLLKIYEKAPVPAPRYGMSKQEQRKLDGLMVGAKPQDDVKLTPMIEETSAKAFAADAPIIAYRDELYRLLPSGRDRYVASMRDASVRIAVAADKEKLAAALETDLPTWAESPDTDKAQVREVADLFGKLRFIESPPYYAYASVRAGKLGWRTRTDTLLTKARAEKLHKRLLDAGAGKNSPPAPPPTSKK